MVKRKEIHISESDARFDGDEEAIKMFSGHYVLIEFNYKRKTQAQNHATVLNIQTKQPELRTGDYAMATLGYSLEKAPFPTSPKRPAWKYIYEFPVWLGDFLTLAANEMNFGNLLSEEEKKILLSASAKKKEPTSDGSITS